MKNFNIRHKTFKRNSLPYQRTATIISSRTKKHSNEKNKTNSYLSLCVTSLVLAIGRPISFVVPPRSLEQGRSWPLCGAFHDPGGSERRPPSRAPGQTRGPQPPPVPSPRHQHLLPIAYLPGSYLVPTERKGGVVEIQWVRSSNATSTLRAIEISLLLDFFIIQLVLKYAKLSVKTYWDL